MYRQIRAYEETAQLIESLVRQESGKKFADVLEDWARQLYPDVYAAIERHVEEVGTLLEETERKRKDAK